ncbi:rRNA processing protein RRP7 [Oopsacas minuta]|uniref:rRNA processing protein RRP7 n=1 Tax=Oopsacas minuta TaxID=111878 RepID=A0AAV7JBX5_9METZ|nr:rRNA processing protein RRP7 [Oopsacas minuta]
MSSNKVGDYYIIDVMFKYDLPSDPHSLYCKVHTDHSDKKELPDGKTLFVAGLPFYMKKESVTGIFNSLGAISYLHISKSLGGLNLKVSTKSSKDPYFSILLPNSDGFIYAYVVFVNEISLECIEELSRNSIESPISCTIVKQIGINSWIEEYKDERPEIEQLQTQVKRFMTKYDARRQTEENTVKKRRNIPDEDGWITVTGKNNKKVPKHNLSKIRLRKVTKKKKKNELLHFYKFQMREEKRDNILQLQKKFDEDKKKITAMKLQRKFKPL